MKGTVPIFCLQKTGTVPMAANALMWVYDVAVSKWRVGCAVPK